MNDKNKKVEVDGFTFTQEEWDEIKDSYVPPITTQWEKIVCKEIIDWTYNNLIAIECLLNHYHYTPEAASSDMYDLAHKFANDEITQAALEFDEVKTATLIELLTGINKREIEDLIIDVIKQCCLGQQRLEKRMYH